MFYLPLSLERSSAGDEMWAQVLHGVHHSDLEVSFGRFVAPRRFTDQNEHSPLNTDIVGCYGDSGRSRLPVARIGLERILLDARPPFAARLNQLSYNNTVHPRVS